MCDDSFASSQLGHPAHCIRILKEIPPVSMYMIQTYRTFQSLTFVLQGIVRVSTTVLIIVAPTNVTLNIGIRSLHSAWPSWIATGTLLHILAVLPFSRRPHVYHKQNGTRDGLQSKAVFDPKGCHTFLKLATPGICMVGNERFVLTRWFTCLLKFVQERLSRWLL